MVDENSESMTETEGVFRYQKQYWNELGQLQIHCYYLENYHRATIQRNKWINVFLTVASNGSIGGWLIWEKLKGLWAGIIAISQLIYATKQYFPYENRLEPLADLKAELEQLFLFAEEGWFRVAEGELTNREIHELIMQIKKRKLDATAKYLKKDPLPPKTKFLESAQSRAATYFENYS